MKQNGQAQNNLLRNSSSQCPNVSTTPITAMGCRQCLPLSVVQLKGKHCRKPHCRNGVVDTFGLCTLYTDNQIHEILKFNFRFFSSLQSLEKWNGRLVRTPIQCDLKSHSINMRYLRDSPHGDSVGLQDETRRLLRQPISTPTRFRTSMSNTQHQSCRY